MMLVCDLGLYFRDCGNGHAALAGTVAAIPTRSGAVCVIAAQVKPNWPFDPIRPLLGFDQTGGSDG